MSAELGVWDANAPAGLDILIPRNKWSMGPLLRAVRPDLVICFGFPWLIPPEALAVPRLGVVNMHPALLPRHRGPIPTSWAVRAGDDTYGVTITSVLVKPKSRGYVELRSANPEDMPVVSPHLLQHPDDMKMMVEGQRFFRDVLLSGPLGKRVEKVIAPEGPDLSDEVMANHCRRFVKTNYHPASTARNLSRSGSALNTPPLNSTAVGRAASPFFFLAPAGRSRLASASPCLVRKLAR